MPDLQRVVDMSRLFGVSTDSLLKDETEPTLEPPLPKTGTEAMPASIRKKRNPLIDVFAIVYWLAMLAIFLGINLLNGSQTEAWIVWIIAGIVFPILICIVNAIANRPR